MTTLEKLSNHIASMDGLQKRRYWGQLLIETKAEIERLGHSLAGAIVEVERREKEQAELEKQNTQLKSALTQILTNSEQMEVHEFGDATVRIVQNALHEHH